MGYERSKDDSCKRTMNRENTAMSTNPTRGPRMSLTLTLYCTIMPKFSFWDESVILKGEKETRYKKLKKKFLKLIEL